QFNKVCLEEKLFLFIIPDPHQPTSFQHTTMPPKTDKAASYRTAKEFDSVMKATVGTAEASYRTAKESDSVMKATMGTAEASYRTAKEINSVMKATVGTAEASYRTAKEINIAKIRIKLFKSVQNKFASILQGEFQSSWR
ncbi:unnamed protein product, partial [Meganyctiphanes norvegica]